MTTTINSLMPFPPINWWRRMIGEDIVCLNDDEPFRKMSFRNRYHITTANGPLMLSVPVTGGREQRKSMKSMGIDNNQDWRKQHWRSLFSAYGRAPFFDHYGPELESIFNTNFDSLAVFNKMSVDWAATSLRFPAKIIISQEAVNNPQALVEEISLPPVHYGQVFELKNGFQPNLSVIDLLMNEGPAAMALLSS